MDEEEPPRLGKEDNLSELERAIFGYNSKDREIYSKAKKIVFFGEAVMFRDYSIREEYESDFLRSCFQMQKCMGRHIATYGLNSDSNWVIENFGEIYKIFYIMKYPERVLKI